MNKSDFALMVENIFKECKNSQEVIDRFNKMRGILSSLYFAELAIRNSENKKKV